MHISLNMKVIALKIDVHTAKTPLEGSVSQIFEITLSFCLML